jgi:hypothetical protein
MTKIFEQKEESMKLYTTWLQNILQSHSGQNSMVLAQVQTRIPVEHNRHPTSKPMHLQPTDFDKGAEKRQPCQ